MEFIDNITRIKKKLDASFEDLEIHMTKNNIDKTRHNVHELITYFIEFNQDITSDLEDTKEKLKLKTNTCVDRHELENCTRKIKECEKKIKEIQTQLEETKTELESKSDCESHISKLKALEEKNKGILNDMNALQQSIQELEEINKELNIKNVKIEYEKSELIKQLRDITDEIDEQRLTIAKHMEKIDEQKTQSLQQELGLVGKNLECQQLKDEVIKYINKNKKLEEELNMLSKRLKISVDKSKTIIRDTQKLL